MTAHSKGKEKVITEKLLLHFENCTRLYYCIVDIMQICLFSYMTLVDAFKFILSWLFNETISSKTS